ncbi:MAG: flagellar basal body L-ring protein FlgH [Acidobacteriaceae bacterium]|nr:flagellar basal body L-ring protein FlgH [Acidobacteriaceae bacterium]
MRRVSVSYFAIACLMLLDISANGVIKSKGHARSSEQLRTAYVERLRQSIPVGAEERVVGSLWTPHSMLSDLAADYKAHQLNDTITIQIAVQTTAAQSGTVNTSRAFSTSSGITGIMGSAPASTNPLLAGQSSTALKGSGQTASNTTFTTSLTGQVIAVLPNGNLIVEAQRAILLNNQHENIIVRGMIRPGDIGPNNTVASAALGNLEIEMKGKGIISDGVRSPNFITRWIQWIFNF